MNLKSIHSILEQERKHLAAELDSLTRINPPESGSGGSWFGQRDEQANQSNESRRLQFSRKRVQEHLAAIDRALQKIGAGTYGLCDICNKPIAPERLQAIPHATLCLSCQAKKK